MQLYHTKVIPASEDQLWSLPADLPDFSHKKILVLSTPYSEGGKEAQTLQKMMAACKLGADEYTSIKLTADRRLAWSKLAAAGAPLKVLMLGIVPGQIGINALFRLNHCNSFLGATFIPSLPLEQLDQHPNMKKELWEEGLKPCFAI